MPGTTAEFVKTFAVEKWDEAYRPDSAQAVPKK
jgi:hypothetical protein